MKIKINTKMIIAKASQPILWLCVLLLGASVNYAQTQFVTDSLSVSTVIPFDKEANYKDYQVKFKKVISDSRCPKNVTCIRAGEAKVIVAIYKTNQFISEKELSIHASGYVMEETNLAFQAEDFKIYGMALKPYPKTDTNIAETGYELELVFQPQPQ